MKMNVRLIEQVLGTELNRVPAQNQYFQSPNIPVYYSTVQNNLKN